jgi:hypothetical protein
MATVQLPNGVKARTETKRRFVVFNENGRPIKRSDNADTAFRFAGRMGQVFVYDQVGKRFI